MRIDEILEMKAGKELDILIATKIFGLVEGVDFGTFSEHQWRLNENNEIDNWAYDFEEHNEPCCTRCYHSYCINCNDEEEKNYPCIVRVPNYSGCPSYIPDIIKKIDGMIMIDIIPMDDGRWAIPRYGSYIVTPTLEEAICKYALIKKVGV